MSRSLLGWEWRDAIITALLHAAPPSPQPPPIIYRNDAVYCNICSTFRGACVSVCWLHRWALQKRSNGSNCRLKTRVNHAPDRHIAVACIPCILPRDAMLARNAVVVYLSVCPTHCVETTGRIELIWSRGLSSTYPTLCYKGSSCSSQITALSFRKICPRQVDQNSSTVEIVDYTYDGRCIMTVYCSSLDRNALILWRRSVVKELYYLFVQLCSSRQDFDRQRVARSLCGSRPSCHDENDENVRNGNHLFQKLTEMEILLPLRNYCEKNSNEMLKVEMCELPWR